MPPIDLSYVKKGAPPSKQDSAVMIVQTRGWGWGYAIYEAEQPKTTGFFRIPDHADGRSLGHARKCVGAFQHLMVLAEEHRFRVLLTEKKDASAPPSSLLPVLSLLVGAGYLEVERGWMDDLGLKRQNLQKWATVLLGKAPEDETVTQALGIGNWFVRQQKRTRGEL